MQFIADDPVPSFNDEWIARKYAWLPSDDPHQRCRAHAIARGVPIEAECACNRGPCTKACCTSYLED